MTTDSTSERLAFIEADIAKLFALVNRLAADAEDSTIISRNEPESSMEFTSGLPEDKKHLFLDEFNAEIIKRSAGVKVAPAELSKVLSDFLLNGPVKQDKPPRTVLRAFVTDLRDLSRRFVFQGGSEWSNALAMQITDVLNALADTEDDADRLEDENFQFAREAKEATRRADECFKRMTGLEKDLDGTMRVVESLKADLERALQERDEARARCSLLEHVVMEEDGFITIRFK